MQARTAIFRMAFSACVLPGIIPARAPAGQNPLPGTSLVPAAWYQADSVVTAVNERVSLWTDLSGNGNHAVQTKAAARPALVRKALPNGKPTLRFGGSHNLLFTTGLLSQNWTCFAVARPDWDNSQKSLLCGADNSFQWRIKRNGETPPGVQNIVRRRVVQLLSGTTMVPTNTHSLLCARLEERLPAHLSTLRLNRASDGSGQVSAATLTNATTEIGGVEFFRGDIAAMVVFTNALGDAEIEAVEGYLHAWHTQYPRTVFMLR